MKGLNLNPQISDGSKPDFALIETILWEAPGYFLLDLHMERLMESARYFSFPCNATGISKALENLAVSFNPSEKYRVRLLLSKSGRVHVVSDVLMPGTSPAKVAVSDKRTDRNNIFLYHKTTHRVLYDRELAKYRENGFFDVIFLNQDNEITEGAISNIIIRQDKRYWTPPVSSGLLPGVYRKYLLKSGELSLKEKVLYMKDFCSADEILIANSVRKLVPVTFEQ